MLAILQLDGLGGAERRRLTERGAADLSRATAAVAPVLAAIRDEGDVAIARFLRDVDGVDLAPARFRLTADEIAAARASLPAELEAAFARTIGNLEVFHRHQLASDWEQEVEPGVVIGERILPVAAAGVYVPFGKAVYPSSALMLTVPARIAGVSRIVLASGADPATGEIPASVVAAAAMGGATELWRVSGTAAVGAWAFGTETLAPVDVVAGPGGPYVAAAKRLVQDRVGVDLDAGPSETLVLALDDADPRLVAVDVLSEAEHGPDSHAYAVCADPALAEAVAAALTELAAELPAERRAHLDEQRAEGRSAIVVAADRDAAIAFADELAVEHVVVHAADPDAVALRLRRAGTVCIGPWTPSPAGSYAAGTNHVLPTGAAARHASGLGVDAFTRRQSFERISEEGLRALRPTLVAYAEHEGLPAHRMAVEQRFRRT